MSTDLILLNWFRNSVLNEPYILPTDLIRLITKFSQVNLIFPKYDFTNFLKIETSQDNRFQTIESVRNDDTWTSLYSLKPIDEYLTNNSNNINLFIKAQKSNLEETFRFGVITKKNQKNWNTSKNPIQNIWEGNGVFFNNSGITKSLNGDDTIGKLHFN
jgi:hypothetical protein